MPTLSQRALLFGYTQLGILGCIEYLLKDLQEVDDSDDAITEAERFSLIAEIQRLTHAVDQEHWQYLRQLMHDHDHDNRFNLQ